MVRKQIFIEEEQNRGLKRRLRLPASPKRQLIREGIELSSARNRPNEDWKVALRQLERHVGR